MGPERPAPRASPVPLCYDGTGERPDFLRPTPPAEARTSIRYGAVRAAAPDLLVAARIWYGGLHFHARLCPMERTLSSEKPRFFCTCNPLPSNDLRARRRNFCYAVPVTTAFFTTENTEDTEDTSREPD